MHVPPLYAADSGQTRAIVSANPLALLVTSQAGVPLATHLPVILEPSAAGDPGTLVGTTLLGHLNRVNPHWHALPGEHDSLLVFRGPHAYISPCSYGRTPAAPTWDFVVTHLHVRVERLPEPEQALDVVRATVDHLDGLVEQHWDQASSVDYFRSIVHGIGALRFTVTDVESMFKLSQEQPRDVRDRVAESLRGRDHHRLAELVEDPHSAAAPAR